jgi:hypothetical protein
MYDDLIIWHDENEPHITGPGEVQPMKSSRSSVIILAVPMTRTTTVTPPGCP